MCLCSISLLFTKFNIVIIVHELIKVFSTVIEEMEYEICREELAETEYSLRRLRIGRTSSLILFLASWSACTCKTFSLTKRLLIIAYLIAIKRKKKKKSMLRMIL